ncbi:MAG: YkgJ family cysteine cluster protein [Planctomycetota bacterium]|nr:YkgJ family cysteine cluster protein [Planctomycetota bacterium]
MGICDGCHAGCCRSFAVPITGADILNLEHATGLTFWDFACRWADHEGSIARNYAPHFQFQDEPGTDFVICLMQKESVVLPDSSKCVFLSETPPTVESPLGVGNCGVYGSRPSACRAFPTKLSRTGEMAVIHDVPERGRGGSNPAYKLCPRPWEPADVDPLEAPRDLVVAKYEMRFFHQLAAVWNREPRDWAMFPDFVRVVYANRVIPEAADIVLDESSDQTATDDDEPQTIPLPVLRNSPRRHVA